MIYKGYDWTELGIRFNLLSEKDFESNNYNEDQLLEDMQTYLRRNADAETVQHLREHLTLLVEHDNSYKTPVWEGLLNVKDDFTLIRISIPLIPYMWD